MKALVIFVAAALGIAGCGGAPTKDYAGDLLSPTVEKPKLDPRLMQVCPDFKEGTLVSGDEESVLNYIKRLGANRKECANNNKAWINWFNRTFSSNPPKKEE